MQLLEWLSNKINITGELLNSMPIPTDKIKDDMQCRERNMKSVIIMTVLFEYIPLLQKLPTEL